jgi:hypothetical protein
MTIQANWTVKTYTLNYSPGSNGTLDGNTSQTVNHGSSGTPVTAIPNEGYNFGGWDDGKTSNPRTDSNVSKSINVTAIFSLTCGNGTCEPELGENALNCPVDCSGVCGDGYCTHDETNQTCPEDCPADCGDAYCDPETETVANCPADCGPVCGDGYCTHDETSETCPEDCGPSATGPTGTNVPETGIFDDSQTSILVGFGLLILGFTWRFVGRGMYSLLGNAPRKISIHLKDMREERSLRRSRKRKQKFEDKVVKD